MREVHSRGSVMGILVVYLSILAALVLILLIYVGTSRVPFGTQIATTIVYTGAVFWLTFFKTRGFNTEYNLWDRAVQPKLHRLLAIHAVFLVLVVSLLTGALALRPHLPAYWFTEHNNGRDTLFSDLLILSGVLISVAQVLISRGILSRSVEAHKKQSVETVNLEQPGRT